MLTKIHHVGIVVRSADAALGFYRDALGLRVTKDAVIAAQGVRGVLLAAGEGEIELLEPTREDTGVARFLASRGEGLHHLCLATDDVAAELDAARAKGLPLIDQAPRLGLAGLIAFLHPRATRGVLIEYAQPLETRNDSHTTRESAEVQELDRVVIAVTDLDAGVETYEHNFGLHAGQQSDSPAFGVREALLPIGRAVVELVTPLGDSGAMAEFLKKRGEGMYLIALAMPDVARATAALGERGVAATEPMTVDGARLSFISPRAAHGVLVQLIEHRS